MSKTNIKISAPPIFTHEGGKAVRISVKNQLRRAVLSCLLWEDSFYENGVEIAKRIGDLVSKSDPKDVANLAIEARSDFKLRHVPLLLIRELVRNPNSRHVVGDLIPKVIQRPDELGELLSLYWKDQPDAPIASQLKKGLAKAFNNFDAYQFAKWKGGGISLRDVMFLTHPKPKSNSEFANTIESIQRKGYKRGSVARDKEHVFTSIAEDNLKRFDTWEDELSAGANKKETFTNLIKINKLGALALLKNLRGMTDAGVERDVIIDGIKNMNTERVLPYRFITAARYAPQFEPQLEDAMIKSMADSEKLNGSTILLIDVSGSMDHAISGDSELKRIDAACGLAILLRELCSDIRIFTFSKQTVEIPSRRGFALRDAIINSQPHKDTYMKESLEQLKYGQGSNRIIVISDEQVAQAINGPKTLGYMLNVASYQNGVGYKTWNHIDGWSEACVKYILTIENEKAE